VTKENREAATYPKKNKKMEGFQEEEFSNRSHALFFQAMERSQAVMIRQTRLS
jgi:hypothetical protein